MVRPRITQQPSPWESARPLLVLGRTLPYRKETALPFSSSRSSCTGPSVGAERCCMPPCQPPHSSSPDSEQDTDSPHWPWRVVHLRACVSASQLSQKLATSPGAWSPCCEAPGRPGSLHEDQGVGDSPAPAPGEALDRAGPAGL